MPGRKAINLKNKIFGRLTVLAKADVPDHVFKRNKSQYWLCLCTCGRQIIVSSDKLRQEHTTSCGCWIQEGIQKMIGQKFGRLTILQRVFPPAKNSGVYYLCQCDCSKQHIASSSSLKNGTQSCGCLKFTYTDPEQCRLNSALKVYKRYSDGDLSFDDFLFLTSQNCFYCDTVPAQHHNAFRSSEFSASFGVEHGDFTYNGIDRLDSSLPHLKSNCVPSCLICNYLKNSDSLQEFYTRIIKIYHNAAFPNKTQPPSLPINQYYSQEVSF